MEFESDNGESHLEPYITVETDDGGEIILSWENTRLRLFNDCQFDHVEVIDSFGNVLGLKAERHLLDCLFEANYPMQFDPLPDEKTVAWFISIESDNLDDELRELSD